MYIIYHYSIPVILSYTMYSIVILLYNNYHSISTINRVIQYVMQRWHFEIVNIQITICNIYCYSIILLESDTILCIVILLYSK